MCVGGGGYFIIFQLWRGCETRRKSVSSSFLQYFKIILNIILLQTRVGSKTYTNYIYRYFKTLKLFFEWCRRYSSTCWVQTGLTKSTYLLYVNLDETKIVIFSKGKVTKHCDFIFNEQLVEVVSESNPMNRNFTLMKNPFGIFQMGFFQMLVLTHLTI